MHALHNAHLIRETLPRDLVKPTPYFEDRRAKHDEFAAELRVTGPARRAEALQKGKETRARNEKKKADAGRSVPELEADDSEPESDLDA